MSALPPGPHGGDAHRLAALLDIDVLDVLDLSISINPAARDPVPVVARHTAAIGHYPDDSRATSALAEALGVSPKRLVLTNGGAEAIALVAQLYPVGWAEACDFSLYRRHLRVLDPAGDRWMSDPNNPTGRLAASDETAFVRDEAFYVLATGRWTRGDTNTIVVGSLTKAFACPGLRVGYVIAPDELIAQQLIDLRPRWTVSGLAAAALPDLLDTADPTTWVSAIGRLREHLTALLIEFGFVAAAGSANYLWIPDAQGLRESLLSHGILVRSGASFGHPDAVRMAVPGERGLERLHSALRLTS